MKKYRNVKAYEIAQTWAITFKSNVHAVDKKNALKEFVRLINKEDLVFGLDDIAMFAHNFKKIDKPKIIKDYGFLKTKCSICYKEFIVTEENVKDGYFDDNYFYHCKKCKLIKCKLIKDKK